MHRTALRLASSIGSFASKKLVCGRLVCKRSYVTKDINFGVGARAAMLQGVNEVAEAVKVTMGPKKSHGDPKVTKDGVTVAKSINFKDKGKNVGAELVKQVAKATNTAAGDGTTCATGLTQAILTKGCKSIAAGVNVMDMCTGINMAIDAVVSDLKKEALMISTPKEITQELENPLILIHDKKITDMNSLVRILELVIEKNRSFLAVAEDVESEAFAMLILNKHHGRIKVIGEDHGLTLDKVQIHMLGSARKVTVSLEDTVILHGGGDKKLIEERREQQHRTAMEKSPAKFDQEKAQDRLSTLSGVVAVFKVAAASEAEVGERKDRVTDALNATRATVEEGIVPGGGVALLCHKIFGKPSSSK